MSKIGSSEHARALASLGASKGGRARIESLTPEQRRELAQHAAEVRWAKRGNMLPKEAYPGVLKIGDIAIDCAVLDNGIRVLSTRGVSRAMGSRKTGTPEGARESGAPNLPPFLVAENIKPFISGDLLARLLSPLEYKPKHGGRSAFGYEATLLPKICEVLLDARKAGKITKPQERLADIADLLIRGFAHVGIIALVDEATGYQEQRARDELHTILEAYISAELLPWTKRFPDEFFRQIYRLHGWEFKPGQTKRPQMIGHLINSLIYEQLPPGVLPELRRRNPTLPSGYRRYKHPQLLTPETGHPHLDKQIVAVTTLMRVAEDKPSFLRLFRRAFPKKGEQLDIAFPPKEDSADA